MGRPKGPVRATREEILAHAGTLFATQGFRAVTVKDIAGAVGIKDASLYNYFPSKQAIFDEVLEYGSAYAREVFASAMKPFRTTGRGTLTDCAAFQDRVLEAIEPLFADERLIELRRLLTVTQYESEAADALYVELFFDRPQAYFQDLLEGAIAARVFEQCNVTTAATELYSVLFMLLALNKRWPEARTRAIAHLRSFERAH